MIDYLASHLPILFSLLTTDVTVYTFLHPFPLFYISLILKCFLPFRSKIDHFTKHCGTYRPCISSTRWGSGIVMCSTRMRFARIQVCFGCCQKQKTKQKNGTKLEFTSIMLTIRVLFMFNLISMHHTLYLVTENPATLCI